MLAPRPNTLGHLLSHAFLLWGVRSDDSSRGNTGAHCMHAITSFHCAHMAHMIWASLTATIPCRIMAAGRHHVWLGRLMCKSTTTLSNMGRNWIPPPGSLQLPSAAPHHALERLSASWKVEAPAKPFRIHTPPSDLLHMPRHLSLTSSIQVPLKLSRNSTIQTFILKNNEVILHK